MEALSCRGCARHAEDALRALPGVRAASVGFFGEIAQVVFDVRATNERDIAATMSLRGFRLHPAAGVRPGARGELDAARIGLTIALLVNLVALAWLRHERAPTTNLGLPWKAAFGRTELSAHVLSWVELGFTTLLLVVAAPPLVRRAVALARRHTLGREIKTLACAAASLALGLFGMIVEGGSFSETLATLGFHPAGVSFIGFEATGAIVGTSLLGLHAHAALERRAFADLHRAARLRIVCGHPSAEVEAAADAQVQRVAQKLQLDALRGGGDGFVPTAALALSVATFSFVCFALVVHGTIAGGPLDAGAFYAAIAVLVGSSSAAFVVGLPAARTIAVLRARALGVVVEDPRAFDALASDDGARPLEAFVMYDGRPDVRPRLVCLARTLRGTERLCLALGLATNAILVPLCAAGLVGPLLAAMVAAAAELAVCLAAALLLRAPAAPSRALPP